MISSTRFSAVASLGWLLILCSSALAAAGDSSDRADRVLDTGWKFIRQDVPSAQQPEFDDSQWQTINLPHTWNAQDGQDGGNNYYRGPGWYRLHCTIDSVAGKRMFLRFEGASLASAVYVNGKSVGIHNGGFAAFCFDVTPMVVAGDNLIAVRVDNSLNMEITPLSGDFTVGGGLYRPVHLLALNPVSISPTDDASPGVYLKPSHVDAASAQITATTKLRNDLDDAQSVSARVTITDAAGNVAARGQTDQSIAAHSGADAVVVLNMDHPHLWNGRLDPYLYRTTVELQLGGRTVDRVVQPLGLRFFHVDPQQGFFLNGAHYALHGVNRHQEHIDMGWATGPEQVDEDYRLMDELGCTVVRMCHYQHPDYEYSVCDRTGIAVWAELTMVNRIGPTPAFYDNAKQQLRELIKQNYNHPSIFFWSLYNELSANTRPHWDLVHELNDLAHQLDPDRLTVAASNLPPQAPVNWIMDITGFNRYYGWYSGSTSQWPAELDKIHAAHPNQSVGISEYGAGASIYHHEDFPTTQPPTKGKWHPEEWQATAHEAAWKAMSQRPWIWGTFVWALADFASDSRNEGDHPGRNDKGLVTGDRKVKKDAFYFYKANWTTEPFVYITSKRFDPRPPGSSHVKVYSNCDSVELSLNGQSLGRKSADDHIFLWPDVVLPEGKCQVQAVGEKNGQRYTDSCVWTVSASATTKPGAP